MLMFGRRDQVLEMILMNVTVIHQAIDMPVVLGRKNLTMKLAQNLQYK